MPVGPEGLRLRAGSSRNEGLPTALEGCLTEWILNEPRGIDMLRFLFSSFILVAIAVPLAVRPASYIFPTRARIIEIKITSDRSVYNIGDSIKLRLTLINRSAQELYVPGNPPPYEITKLQVLDERGHALLPTEKSTTFLTRLGKPRVTPLPPYKLVVLQFDDPDHNWQLNEWADIRHWGYKIKRPGNYTIFASPSLTAFSTNIDREFRTSPADKSNTLRIIVLR